MFLYRTAKRIVILVIGLTVIFIGLAMTVLPGPAIIVIPLGLAILASEFAWAKYWLHKYKNASKSVWTEIKARAWGRETEKSVQSTTAPPASPLELPPPKIDPRIEN